MKALTVVLAVCVSVARSQYYYQHQQQPLYTTRQERASPPAPPPYKPAPAPYPSYPPASYAFDWKVLDTYTKNDYGHQETRNGDAATGSYYVALPDGRLQTVSYSVDGYGGYVADVSYEGEPAYPEAAPYHPAPPAPYHPAPKPYHPAPYHPAPAYPRPSYPVQPHAAPSVVKPKVAEAPAAAAAKPAEESREAKAIEAAPVQQAQTVARTTSLPRIVTSRPTPASRFRPVPAASNVRRFSFKVLPKEEEKAPEPVSESPVESSTPGSYYFRFYK